LQVAETGLPFHRVVTKLANPIRGIKIGLRLVVRSKGTSKLLHHQHGIRWNTTAGHCRSACQSKLVTVVDMGQLVSKYSDKCGFAVGTIQ
jgi:hypothetical protein